MSSPLADNYLFLQPLVEARIRDRVAGLPVEGVEQMAQIVEAQDRRAEVCFVMWGGDRFADTANAGDATQVVQEWVLWLRVINASAADKDARSSAAGARLAQLHAAMAGFKPAGCARGFRRTNGPRPNYQPASGLYPLSFGISLHL
ncbi:MAG: hypothetical protein ACKVQR_15015 [Aquabacterium sp.]